VPFPSTGPGGPNGIHLHFQMMRVARSQAKRLRGFDVRAESQEAALAEMKAHFPDYIFLGSWAAAQAKRKLGQIIVTRVRADSLGRRIHASLAERPRAVLSPPPSQTLFA